MLLSLAASGQTHRAQSPDTGPTATDPTFAGGGSVNVGFITETILSQSSGKILVVGHGGVPSSGQEQGVIEQLKSNGALDTTFGHGGMIVTPAGQAYYAAAMPDAKHFIAAGTSDGDFVLREYNLSGTIDNSFGTNGTVITDFGTASDTARAIAIGADGRIGAGGDSGGNFAFARYLPNGQLDPDFAQAGRQLFAVGSGNNGLGAIAIQSDGRVVATGAEGSKVVVVRLTGAGEADGTFGNGGVSIVNALAARTDLGEPDHTEGLALMSDGGILVANRTASGHFGLVRHNSDGAVDNSFGANGLATADFGGDDDADSIVLQSTGPVIVIGTSVKSGTAQTAVAAFDPSGAPINSFGNNGLLTLPSGIAGSVAAQQTTGAVTTKALHIGDIILRAFGIVTADGRVIIGTTNQAVAATSSSTLRRLIVPGALLTGQSSGTLLGTFGFVDGRTKKLAVSINGTTAMLSLLGGTATAYQDGSALDLTVDDGGRGVMLSVNTGGTTVTLGNVTVSGTLRGLAAPSCDLSGTLHVTGSIGRLLLHNMTGSIYSGSSIAAVFTNNLSGTVFAVEAIGRLKATDLTGTVASGNGVVGNIFAASMENALVLSGANFGDDGHLGGVDPDTFGPGSIGAIRVAGAIASSFIGAGVDPVDSIFGNSNDKAAGTAPSVIRFISAQSADTATHFEARSFGQVRLGQAIHTGTDARFRILTGTASKPVTATLATPSIGTTQQPATTTVGTSIADQAAVSGGSNPSGTVTFKLYDNANASGTPLFTDTETLSGGIATSAGFSTTAAGTVYWVATYNSDSNNNSVTSGTASGPVTVNPFTPTITASAGPTMVIGTAVPLAATATLSGGFNATGSITFTLYGPDNGPALSTVAAPVSGNGVYATPTAYIPSVAGTYRWVASYSGDVNNTMETTLDGAAPEVAVGPGATLVGTTLYLVGGNTNDQVNIQHAGTSATGSTGIEVKGRLNGVSIDDPRYATPPALIDIVLFNGNDTVSMEPRLTISVTVSDGAGDDNIQLGQGNNTITLGSGNNDQVHVGDGNNVIQVLSVKTTTGDQIQAGDGNNLIAGGLGQENIQAGNGNNILIDGNVALTQSSDSFAGVLSDWTNDILSGKTSSQIHGLLFSRLNLTDNTTNTNRLKAGSGLDWFWFTDAKDRTNIKSTDLHN